jgi:hypothetical protein
MGFFDDEAIVGRFDNSTSPQQNLQGFSNIWTALTNSGKLKGAFFFVVNLGGDAARLAVWIDYYDTAQTHSYLVIDGPFLSAANREEVQTLLGLTEEFQAKSLAAGLLPITGAGQKVFYCKYPAPDTSDLPDAGEAARVLSEAWLKANWQRTTAEEFLTRLSGHA